MAVLIATWTKDNFRDDVHGFSKNFVSGDDDSHLPKGGGDWGLGQKAKDAKKQLKEKIKQASTMKKFGRGYLELQEAIDKVGNEDILQRLAKYLVVFACFKAAKVEGEEDTGNTALKTYKSSFQDRYMTCLESFRKDIRKEGNEGRVWQYLSTPRAPNCR